MSLSKPERWILKDKNGNPPPPNIETFIRKLRKENLLPCPRTPDDLQMPDKGEAPREMNSFIVFRRQLAHVAKMGKTSDDGRVISAAASFIWNGASQEEKRSYTLIADELKRRHRIKYPNYTYERRKRKTESEDFIVYTGAVEQNKNKKRQKKSQPAPKVIPVPEQQQEPECVPITTISSPEGNEGWFNPLTSQAPQFSQADNNNYCYNPTYYDNECFASLCEENIPIVYQIVTNSNYTNSNPQLHAQNLLLFQQPQEPIQQLSPTYDEFDIFNGIPDMGINQSTYVELERPINEVIYSNYIE